VTKIAFHLLENGSWQAGITYLLNLLRALREIDDKNRNLYLLLSEREKSVPKEIMELVDERLAYPEYKRWSASWVLDRGVKRALRRDLNADFYLKRHGVDLIAFGEAPQGSKTPWLSWLPDFQHIHLPEMFSPEECEKRNDSFMRIAENSTRVVLLSESVKRDFESFVPPYARKALVVRPASYISPTVYETPPKSVADAYRLPDRFIYLPNQFWKHKNHAGVFRAVRLLNDQGVEVFVVCSGNLIDYRHPTYFSELLQLASHLGIWRQIIFLGLIPREHVFALIRQSICVLNPSLFEGFGLSADEARSVGKQVLLSDIDAHREQSPPGAVFFDPRDHEGLATKMAEVWCEKPPGPDFEFEAEARDSLPGRMKAFGEAFISGVQEVLS
jgi:hypothetical protein